MSDRIIELLAPAGSWEALEAAVNAGADAVYMGGKSFGARAYASNFDKEEMAKAVYFAHMHHVRLYITVNTLVDDSELGELAEYLMFLNNVGVDGIIVQDLGVIRLAKQIVPELPLHASTQMTITNSSGVDFAVSAGMERSVLARELSLKEIEAACSRGTEIETFIHGALCVCYSGQCLMSSLIGGRSGNRGRCAQPCRLPYKLLNAKGEDMLAGKDAGQYLLSPKDMNTLEILPQLIEAGVVSYKIEGRMKRPEYVAVVVDAYRRAIDSYKAGNYQVPAEDLANIEQIFNRDFTTAYMTHRPGKEMMSDRRPNNRGVLIGRVSKLDKQRNKATVKLEKELHLGDGLEFWVSVGGRVGTTVTEMLKSGQSVECASPGEQVVIDVPKGVRLNDRVFRTLDSRLMAYAGQFFGPEAKRRIPVDAVVTAKMGQPMTVVLTDDEGNVGYGETNFIVEAARKRALDDEVVRKQIDRMGTTEYCLNSLTFEHDENVMVPMSEMNEARRMACEALDAARLEAFAPARTPVHTYKAQLTPAQHKPKATQAKLTVHCDSVSKVNAALQAGAERILFGGDCFNHQLPSNADYTKVAELCRKQGRELAFATPRIVKEAQLNYFAKLFELWQELVPDFVYINNNGLWPLAKKYNLPVVADMSLNIFNVQSLEFWQEQGARGAVLSLELTMGQVEHLASVSPMPLECMIQGRLEMMVSEYCVGGSFLGDLHKGACQFNCREQLFLGDRKEAQFPIATDQFCRMHVLNAHELSMVANVQHMAEIGVASLRIDARTYDEARLAELIELYRRVLGGAVEAPENLPGTTRGHYYRGVM
ncbi:MAG: U32 family peptidase [Phascolarctobacterium sp.]|nr:U32 family peptidase [Phascolarctobacterium sp.]